MVILVNPSAGGGRALGKFRKIQPRLRELLGPANLIFLDDGVRMQERVSRMLTEGHTEFIAAGGDGTVNLLLESIMENAPPTLLPGLKMGAIGLGSSNDFHKPFRPDGEIAGVPIRIDFDRTVRHDVGLLTFEDDGGVHTRYWLINASIGVTAEANSFFNGPDAVLRALKQFSTGGAIAYAALHALATHRNRRMTLGVDGGEAFETFITNIGVVKNPNFSGTFSYGSPYEPDSGHFYVHLCENMSRPRILTTLWRSSRKGFAGLPSTHSWRTRRFAIGAGSPFAIEFDGEVVRANSASFSMQQAALQVCT
jgi:diacylglycerol kinase (ATP)